MSKPVKVRMNVSIASATWAFQPGQIAAVDPDLAKTWLRNGHASAVDQRTPISEPNLLADLSAEEALTRRCESCDVRRAQFVFRNRPFCAACYRAHLEG